MQRAILPADTLKALHITDFQYRLLLRALTLAVPFYDELGDLAGPDRPNDGGAYDELLSELLRQAESFNAEDLAEDAEHEADGPLIAEQWEHDADKDLKIHSEFAYLDFLTMDLAEKSVGQVVLDKKGRVKPRKESDADLQEEEARIERIIKEYGVRPLLDPHPDLSKYEKLPPPKKP